MPIIAGKSNRDKPMERAAFAVLKAGSVSVPQLLLQVYPRLKLSDAEVMLIIHLIAFKEKDQKEFPTIEEIQARMSASPDSVIEMLQRLMKAEIINIDEAFDPVTGIQSEAYNLDPLYAEMAAIVAEEQGKRFIRESGDTGSSGRRIDGKDLFSIFEKEFARPLSPMECETISGWLDGDQYSEELILAALKEAVFAGKMHFRYIDRILLEWHRNRVTTPEQAKEHAQKFRSSR